MIEEENSKNQDNKETQNIKEEVELNFLLYHLIDPRNNKPFYVGITTQPLEKRLKDHLSESKYNKNLIKSKKITNIINKSGLYPKIELIDNSSKTIEELKQKEIYYIKLYRETYKKLMTNMTDGGDNTPLFDPVMKPIYIEKLKETKKKNFIERIEREAKEINMTVEEYKIYRTEQFKIYRKELDKRYREKRRIHIQKKREELRKQIGDKEYKRLVREEANKRFKHLSPEEKQKKYDKHNEREKLKRKNETEEERKLRLEKAKQRREGK